VLHFTEVDEPTDLRLVAIDVEGTAGDDGDVDADVDDDSDNAAGTAED